MGCMPHHPFFLKVIDSLPLYDRSWVLPYITVMGSTGPLFLSVIWRHYNSAGPLSEADRVRILFPDEYSKHSWSFFKIYKGSSWHRSDVRVIMWMARHWLFLTVLGFMIAGVVFSTMWWLYGRLFMSQGPRGHQSFKRRFFGRKFDSAKDAAYELLNRGEDRLEA
jgi:inositol phosphorylceramide mannosyltransferase catalytic subunit